MLKEFRRDVFVNVILPRQLNCDPHEVEREHSHPARTVALLKMSAVRKLGVSIEHADVVEPEKAALKDVIALGVLAIHPPGEGDEHFVENRFQKCAIAFAALFPLDLKNSPGRPG